MVTSGMGEEEEVDGIKEVKYRGKSGRLSSSGLPQRAAGPGTEVWTARL